MEEHEFWPRLERRICAEFEGFDDKRLRMNWCDGLIAEQYELRSPRPCITGRAWCGPSGQEPWTFRLFVDPSTRSYADIDWSTLLPADRSTGWLSPDPDHKTMTIDPRHGQPS